MSVALFNDYVDFDGALSEAAIEAALRQDPDIGMPISAYLIRADLFDRYPGGKTVRRVYVWRGPAATTLPPSLAARFR